MAIDIKNLPEDLKKKEEEDARIEGVAKVGLGLVGLFTIPWFGVAVAGVGALTYAYSFFISDEQKKLEYRSTAIKTMIGGAALTTAFTSFVLLAEGVVNAISGRRDGPFAPIANISRFMARKLTNYPEDYPQTEVEMLAMQRQQQPTKEVEMVKRQQQRTSQPAEETLQQAPVAQIDMTEIKKATNSKEVKVAYSKSIESSKAREFLQVGEPILEKGVTTIVFGHPDNPNDKSLQVTYTIENDKVISITPGDKASCTLAPIEKPDGNCELITIKNGKQALVHNTGGERTKIVKAELVAKPSALGNQKTIHRTPPIKNPETSQRRLIRSP